MMKLLLIVLTLIFLFIRCHKPCTPGHFSFGGGTAKVQPDKDSIRVGDTLWFTTTLPLYYAYDSVSGPPKTYNLREARFVSTDIGVATLTGKSQSVGAIDSFSFTLPLKGSVVNNSLAPSVSKTITYVQEGNGYNFSIGLVAQKKGIYSVNIAGIYQAMKNCDRISVDIAMTNIDKHMHYLRDVYYNGSQVPAKDSISSYCFKVY